MRPQPASRALGDHGPFDKPRHKPPTAPRAPPVGWLSTLGSDKNPMEPALGPPRLQSASGFYERLCVVKFQIASSERPSLSVVADPGQLVVAMGSLAQVWIVESQFSQCPSCHCHGATWNPRRVRESGAGSPRLTDSPSESVCRQRSKRRPLLHLIGCPLFLRLPSTATRIRASDHQLSYSTQSQAQPRIPLAVARNRGQ